MFCPECGTKNSEEAQFCGNCGTTLGGSSPTPAPSATSNPSTQQGYSSPPPQQGYSSAPQQGYGSAPQYGGGQPNQGYAQPQGGYNQSVYHDGPQTRSWGLWFLGSIFLFGIPYLIYSYFIVEDMNKLERLSGPQHDRGKGMQMDTTLSVLLIILFYPAFAYMKFNALHDHVSLSHNQYEKPISGSTYIILFVLSFFLMFFGIGFLLYFVLLYQEYKWQSVMNAHIRFHQLA